MKSIGIVRRIDEMGRIVIPKEIRKTLRINNNDSIEIYIEGEDKIILKKYSLLKKIDDFTQKFVDSMYAFIKHNIIITDTKDVIAVAGSNKKNYINQPISENLENSILRRENILEKYQKDFELIKDKKESGTYTISTIIANGDAVGLVVITSNGEEIGLVEEKMAKIASQFLGKYLEQ
ncbi:MAG: stage V sporulation T C-terminal domain-containing protein [Bacilli bacterium]|nr:stage V sporulation T C-terminal domain-containing protein [Bacilli bacterium]MDD4282228.1 stage V sporulation T C-terminal domain-containing protein [Bacilli bacterium]MDD4718227.1 stage V sporulation T C-terminal domain-containing protein [Bacilli bacterium]